MKRFTMIVALLLMVAMPMMAERVSPETARKVATTFLNNNGAKSAQLTDLSKAAGFANLYIFNGEEGFVVMAADDCVRPILGYSLDGEFVVDDMPDNVRWWLQGYSDQIADAVAAKAKATAVVARQWKELASGAAKAAKTDVVVGPLISTKWSQGSPYNNLCPLVGSSRAVTGCVATAMAQVMKYWNYPSQGTGSHTYTWSNQDLTANFGETTYDWANMTNTYGSLSTAEQKTAVATLMYHCGVAVEMNYGTSASGGSSASTYDVMNALQTYFNYAPGMRYKTKDDLGEDQWIAQLKLELADGRPLQYRGSDAGGGGGHSFVCDGYDSDDNFHFNWGWGGSCDGFYSVNDMEPGTGGIGAGNGVYTVGQSAIFGIEPVSTLPSPTLSATASGNTITLSWDAVAEAESYDVYRDNAKVASQITETTYTDTDIASGVYYDYHVRAINSETKSNPSNVVTAWAIFRNIAPSNLTAEKTDNGIYLEWTGYEGGLSSELHYGAVTSNSGWNAGETQSYWGQRYAATLLGNFLGMELQKISVQLFYALSYSYSIYNGSITESDKIKDGTYNKTQQSMAWVDFEFDTPLQIDCTKDLWIVVNCSHGSNEFPAVCGYYMGNGAEDAKYIAESLEDLPNSTMDGNDISWMIKLQLTDGTYTYNIYDGATKLNSEAVTATTFTHESPASNTAHQYTVKTNYYGGESAASNMAALTLGTASLSSLELGENDKMTVTAGSELTVSGTLSDINEGNLVIEDGAQLIHNTAGVKATVKKSIVPYTADDNGWNFIASPVAESITPSADNGLLSGIYDLYYYDEPTHYWMNHRKSPFVIEHKKGYLYANSATTELLFAGTLVPSDESVTIENLSHSAETLNGFNLVGNPFACNATIDQDCYVIDHTTNTVVLAETGRQIAPGEAVFVKATAENDAVTFTKAGVEAATEGSSLDIVVAQATQNERGDVPTGPTTLDRARVRLGEGTGMEKFSLSDSRNAELYIPQNGQDLAVACANGVNEMPLNFKAAKNGTYTLAFEVKKLDLGYLHLIDNMTGNDIDLLALPTYTFEAKTSDYASRFRLVFAEPTDGPSADDQPFAYYANGEIRIVADACDASLQVVDATGHVIVSTDVARNVSTSGMPAGVYVLRLVSGDIVRTQKIVID